MGVSDFTIDRRRLVAVGLLSGLPAAFGTGLPGRANAAVPPKRSVFSPGQPWLDTSGKPIYENGTSTIAVDGVFYWYGENKERTTGKGRIWHWGMRIYSSSGLYNWTDLGNFIPPVTDDPAFPLHPFQLLDRPPYHSLQAHGQIRLLGQAAC